jgi:transposase
VSLEEQLMAGTLEFALHTLVETRMDMSRFAERFCNDETGRSAYDPKLLLKIVLLAYARGMISSRKIERACRENVVFIALCCGQHPDHSTIAAFVATLKEEIQPLFRDVLLVCDEMGLLGGTEFALDGCKLPGNASKKWSGTFTVLQEKQGKLERRVQQLLEEQVSADRKEGEAYPEGSKRSRQVEQLQKQAERIARFLQENTTKPGTQHKEVQSNITDNESALMHTAHGAVQGYNAQALVDAKQQVIVQGEAFGWGQDHYHVTPVIEGAKENMVAIGHAEDYFAEAILTADTSYHSNDSIEKCEQERIDAYIPDKDFRK